MAQKKYVSLSKLSTFLDNLKNTFASSNDVATLELAVNDKASVDHTHAIADVDSLQDELSEIDDILAQKSQVQMITSDTTETLSTLKIHRISQEQYDQEFENGTLDANALYLTPDEEIDWSVYATVEQLNEKADADHNHDDIYYTETEVNDLLGGKSDTSHNHDEDYDAKGSAAAVQVNLDVLAQTVNGKADTDHSHDDIYYTEDEIDELLEGYSLSTHNHNGVYAVSNHSHDDIYYTENEIDNLLDSKSDKTHNHNGVYDTYGAAETALSEAKAYTDTTTSSLASTAVVDNKISTHNTSTMAHSDIRDLISELGTKVNNFLDVDETTTDQLSEVLTLIENNKGTLESLTYSKVNVSDIVDNLTTANASKVLSAKQCVAIQNLINALQAELDSHTHAIADVNGLQDALNGKAASSHTHAVEDITDLAVTATELNYVSGATSNIQTQLNNLTTTVNGKAESSHTHDDAYYTKSETNALLNNKSDANHNHDGVYALSSHSHDDVYYTEAEINALLQGYSLNTHNHNDIYYTESEVNALLNNKANTNHNHDNIYANISHTHNDIYYTENEIDALIANHKHDSLYDTYGSANAALGEARTYTDNAVAQKSQVQFITWEAND